MQIGARDFTPGAAFAVPGKVRMMGCAADAHLVRVWRCKKIGKEVSAEDCRACFGPGSGRPTCKAANASDPTGLSVLTVEKADLVAKSVRFADGFEVPLGFLLGLARAGRLKKVERAPMGDVQVPVRKAVEE